MLFHGRIIHSFCMVYLYAFHHGGFFANPYVNFWTFKIFCSLKFISSIINFINYFFVLFSGSSKAVVQVNDLMQQQEKFHLFWTSKLLQSFIYTLYRYWTDAFIKSYPIKLIHLWVVNYLFFSFMAYLLKLSR